MLERYGNAFRAYSEGGDLGFFKRRFEILGLEFGGETFFREEWKDLEFPSVQEITRKYLLKLFSRKQGYIAFRNNREAAQRCLNHREKSICEAAHGISGFSFGKLKRNGAWGAFELSVCDFINRTFNNEWGEQDPCPEPRIVKTCPLGFYKKTGSEIHDECLNFYKLLGDDVVEFLSFKTYI
ncbi:MAG: hypothetical protein ABIH35_00335 [Patescibacteria group bacterium]